MFFYFQLFIYLKNTIRGYIISPFIFFGYNTTSIVAEPEKWITAITNHIIKT